MRALALTLVALISQPALALGPYACRPSQMFGGGTSVATISIGRAGPLTLRDAYAMASNKRSAISRLSEMRERGEIVDLIALPEGPKKP